MNIYDTDATPIAERRRQSILQNRRASINTRDKYSERARRASTMEQREQNHDQGRRGSMRKQSVLEGEKGGVEELGAGCRRRSTASSQCSSRRGSAANKPRLSLRYVGNGYSKYMQTKWLRNTEYVPPNQVFKVLDDLSKTLIFRNATPEEKVLLGHRLRHLVVEEGTYLIREGESEDSAEPAIFMIASGRATISINKSLPDGTIQEVDIKDIKCPDYFGEGRVLTSSPAYASVRAKAKQSLGVYFLLKQDIMELASRNTLQLMRRDMSIRKFQKDHLDDLFTVVKDDPGGMLYLCKFAKEQHLGKELRFYNEVMAFRSPPNHMTAFTRLKSDRERAGHVQHMYREFIEPLEGASRDMVVYTTPQQRKQIKDTIRRVYIELSEEQNVPVSLHRHRSPRVKLPPLRTHPQCEKGGKGGIECESPREPLDELYAGEEKKPQLTLAHVFDSVLQHSVIPTVEQNIMPKFIQSKYFERYLHKRFPVLEATLSEANININGAAAASAVDRRSTVLRTPKHHQAGPGSNPASPNPASDADADADAKARDRGGVAVPLRRSKSFSGMKRSQFGNDVGMEQPLQTFQELRDKWKSDANAHASAVTGAGAGAGAGAAQQVGRGLGGGGGLGRRMSRRGSKALGLPGIMDRRMSRNGRQSISQSNTFDDQGLWTVIKQSRRPTVIMMIVEQLRSTMPERQAPLEPHMDRRHTTVCTIM